MANWGCIHAVWLNTCILGDLHDGAGLSDATDPNGLVSNPIFEDVQYDLLSIGAMTPHLNYTQL